MRLLPEIRSSIHGPAVSETDLSCWEITYFVSAFIFFFFCDEKKQGQSVTAVSTKKKCKFLKISLL